MEWTETPRIDTLGSLYGYDNPTSSGFLGANELSNDAMMYSANASSRTLRDEEGVKVEADLQLL